MDVTILSKIHHSAKDLGKGHRFESCHILGILLNIPFFLFPSVKYEDNEVWLMLLSSLLYDIVIFSFLQHETAPCRRLLLSCQILSPHVYMPGTGRYSEKNSEWIKILWKLYIVIHMWLPLSSHLVFYVLMESNLKLELIYASEIIHCSSCALNMLLAEKIQNMRHDLSPWRMQYSIQQIFISWAHLLLDHTSCQMLVIKR